MALLGRCDRSDAVIERKRSRSPMPQHQESRQDVDDDDDDDDGYYELDAEILLRQYLNCNNLVAAQRARAETVDEYIVPLNERKTKLRRIVRQYENDIGSLQSKHDQLDAKYRALSGNRVALQKQIDELVRLIL